MAFYGYPCTGCGLRDCDGCETETEPAIDRCVDCGRFCAPRADRPGMCPRCHARATSSDPRDRTPEPPAYLDPRSVLRMQRMVKDAAANGDRPWPYTRDAA